MPNKRERKNHPKHVLNILYCAYNMFVPCAEKGCAEFKKKFQSIYIRKSIKGCESRFITTCFYLFLYIFFYYPRSYFN